MYIYIYRNGARIFTRNTRIWIAGVIIIIILFINKHSMDTEGLIHDTMRTNARSAATHQYRLPQMDSRWKIGFQLDLYVIYCCERMIRC